MDFESLFTQICHDLEKSGDVKEISTRFSTCSTDAQRISFVLALDSVRARFQEPLSLAKRAISTPSKSQQLSTSHRVEGNNYYQKKLNWKAISSYNRSLLVGEGEALALAYANRSAVFHDTSDWLHSLRDIQLAFDHGYPEHLEYKLRERQGNCWLQLGHVRQAFISFNLARNLLLVTTTNAQSHKDKLISINSKIVKLGDDANPTIGVSESNESAAASIERQIIKKRRTAPDLNRDSNALLPAASTSIELTDSDDRGRCLVATEDIQIGKNVTTVELCNTFTFEKTFQRRRKLIVKSHEMFFSRVYLLLGAPHWALTRACNLLPCACQSRKPQKKKSDEAVMLCIVLVYAQQQQQHFCVCQRSISALLSC